MLSGRAPAKVNLYLHVTGRRADGYHLLDSLAVFPAVGDVLRAEPAAGLSLVLAGPFGAALAADADNLVLRAARALAEAAGISPRARLILTKNLPVASGIGGGSADAAAALRALSSLWNLTLDEARLREIAVGLGSDVPVCLAGDCAFMEGRGEILTAVKCLPRLSLLLVNPGVAVSTREVFAALQSRSGVGMKLPQDGFGDSADLLRFLDSTRNDLEAPARVLQPVIGALLDSLCGLPGALFARMSGSGASCFGIFADDESCRRGGAQLRAQHPGWWIAPTSVAEFNIVHEDQGRDIGPTGQGL